MISEISLLKDFDRETNWDVIIDKNRKLSNQFIEDLENRRMGEMKTTETVKRINDAAGISAKPRNKPKTGIIKRITDSSSNSFLKIKNIFTHQNTLPNPDENHSSDAEKYLSRAKKLSQKIKKL